MTYSAISLSSHLSVASGIKDRVIEVRNQLDADLSRAETHKDQHLSPDGLMAKRSSLKAAAKERARAAIKPLREHLAGAEAFVNEHAGAALRDVGADAAAVIRSEQKWLFAVEGVARDRRLVRG